MTRRMAALRPSWASETGSFSPRRPRRTKFLRKMDQKVSASEGPMCSPTISRLPSVLAATAIIAATEMVRANRAQRARKSSEPRPRAA